MEAPISPNKRSHSSFDLFVEAAGKRFEDETFGGMYSNSVSSQSENEPPDFQNDIYKRSKFNSSYSGEGLLASFMSGFVHIFIFLPTTCFILICPLYRNTNG